LSDTANKGITDEMVLEAWQIHNGSVRAVAKQLGIARSTVYHYVKKMGLREEKPMAGGNMKPRKAMKLPLPKKGVKRYLLTSLQSNTPLHPDVWVNILALKKHWKADLKISRFTYNKNAYGKMSVKPGTKQERESELWFDPMAEPFFSDEYEELAPGLHWCGHTNDLPTTLNPLAGYETYTGAASSIFPHATFRVQCVPTSKMEPTKWLYTSGTVGQMNYIQKKAGVRAEHHHSYGCLVAEVNSKGDWWVRQLHAGPNGELYDLDVIAQKGKVKKATGKSVFAINWGDIHFEKPDEDLFDRSWSPGGILDELHPEEQFLHDTFDPPRNHHDDRDPYKRLEYWAKGVDSVEGMFRRGAQLIRDRIYRPWCKTNVVNSNHDDMTEKWTAYADWKDDPVNAEFLLECQLALVRAVKQNDEDFYLPEWACKRFDVPDDVKFLRRDEDHIRLGIQFGQHGHLGANGARGSAASYAKMGMKANRGHDHTASWIWGILTAGIWGDLDQGYNDGLSSWSQTMIVTYKNGRRALVTIWKGKHKA